MKYLKYCETDVLGEYDYKYEQHFMGTIEGQPKQGPTIICFKNPNTGVTRTVYTGKNIYKEDESPIQYTWRYEESYNGHPAIIVNFSRIDSGYADNIVCLESNNMSRGTAGYTVYYMASNKYNLTGTNNNTALNVLTTNGFGWKLNLETKAITWYRLGDLNLNTDYPIYITVTQHYINNAYRMNDDESGYGYIPNDWEVRINVRPTIRGSFSYTYSHMLNDFTWANTFIFKHTPDIPAKDYILVKFLYARIFEL